MLLVPTSGETIIGIDEVGRGCIAGPVVAAAVVWGRPIEGLGDSKKITPLRRARLVPLIKESAAAFSIGQASVEEVDEINILQATFLAMRRALEGLPREITEGARIWIDGNAMPVGMDPDRVELFIGGDATHAPISAASILAKEWRDDLMKESARLYPDFGFEKHMGYGTAYHLAALDKVGPCILHRRTFAPVAKRLKT
jgi:ribonuclease HII